MPTVCTAELDESGFDVKKWITETLVRGFGVCAEFRDRGKMSESEILEALEKNVRNPYYKNELAKAEAELARLKELSDEEWKGEMEKANKEERERYEKRIKEIRKIREGHEKARLWLSGLLTCDISYITRQIVESGLKQLETVKDFDEDETMVAVPKFWSDVSQFKAKLLSEAETNVELCKKELAAEQEREIERLQVYKRLLEDVYGFDDKIVAYCVAKKLSES